MKLFFTGRQGKQTDKKRSKQQQEAYEAILSTANLLLLNISDEFQRAAIYDFLIWSLGQQIASDSFAYFASMKPVPENRELHFIDRFPRTEGVYLGKQDFDLAKIPSYIGPWDYGRFANGIQSILSVGYQHTKEAPTNHGVYYRELDFALMLEGRHHTSWAVYSGRCIQSLDVVSLEPYFPIVQTDGESFLYTSADGYPVNQPVYDIRIAAMYRLAQMRWEEHIPFDFIRNVRKNRDKAMKESADAFRKDLDLASDSPDVLHTLLAKTAEIQTLKPELALKNHLLAQHPNIN